MIHRPREAQEPFIARDATYHRAPAGLRERVQASIAHEGRSRTTDRVQRFFLWGAAFAAVSVVSWNLALLQTHAAEDLLERDVASAHMRSVMPTGKLADVLASDRHEVKPWFTGKLDFAPPVSDLSSRGFTLVGGRIDYVDGRTVAAVTYRYRLHTVNVFEWPARSAAPVAPAVTVRRGYNIVHWSRDGMERWAISDLAVPELGTIVE
jgi:anti-sigma factor RsiW